MPHKRPLSPHLQIYRPQLTSILSITHRITGMGLLIGLVMLTWFLMALAGGPPAYEVFQSFSKTPIGTLMLMGWAAAGCWHVCSGVRHLFFDTGKLFEIRHAYAAGYAVMAASILLMLGVWLFAAT